MEIYELVLPFLITLLLTPLIRKVSVYAGAYAKENKRTVHHGKISRIGGIAIYTAYAAAMAVYPKCDQAMLGIFIASSLVFFTGLADDFFDLKPGVKMILQLCAALILVYFGIHTEVVRLPFGIAIESSIVSVLFTVIWVVGITNAVNLSDGLDGLAGGIALIVFGVLAAISLVDRRYDIFNLCLIFVGALLGFLIYNAHPASIFMGDCGSLLLGFVIAAISLLGFKSSTIFTLALPILILMVPIIDTFSAILRRQLKGQSFAAADRSHLHHQLLRRFGHGTSVLIICFFTFLFGMCGFLYIYDRQMGFAAIIVLLFSIEVFIEKTGMISKKFRPLLSLLDRLLNPKSEK